MKLNPIFKISILIVVTSLSIITLSSKTVDALTGTNFNPGLIIDDATFLNKNSMTVAQIQDFLNSKVPVCDTAHQGYTGNSGTTYNPPWVCLKDYYENPSDTYTISFNYQDTNGVTQTDSRTYYKNNAYKYTTLSPIYVNGDYHQGLDHLVATINSVGGVIPDGGISAAQIIYDASQQYGINPQVILVTLQKEQGLITDTWPSSWRYQSALGYGCPDYKPCSGIYAGFSKQVYSAAWQFRQYGITPDQFNFKSGVTRYIQYNENGSCGGSNVFLQNQATASLYNYTPYQPNGTTLATMSDSSPSSTVGCGAYGNQNFFWYFTKWFGSTYGTVYNGVDYGAVFDANFYLTNHPDIKSAYGINYYLALQHFVLHGMSEGRQASESFNPISYKNRYYDLRYAFGDNLTSYYLHYISSGKKEGRLATGNEFNGMPMYNGVDYSYVYNFNYYISKYPDIAASFSNNEVGAIAHFVQNGMKEGRQANDLFNVYSYKNQYYDLRYAFGQDLKQYYLHYMYSGKKEGRFANGNGFNAIPPIRNGIDYSAVYDYNFYTKNNPDVFAAFGYDDVTTLTQFIQSGMKEGRQAIGTFEVHSYKNRYVDLQQAFSNDLAIYYIHYIYSGQPEGRIGN